MGDIVKSVITVLILLVILRLLGFDAIGYVDQAVGWTTTKAVEIWQNLTTGVHF